MTGVDGGLAHLTDTQPANECSYGPSVEKLDESHFATLRKQGVVVIDHAVNAEELLAVRNDLSAIGTELSCAGYGKGETRRLSVRDVAFLQI